MCRPHVAAFHTRTVAITVQLALHGMFVLHEQLRSQYNWRYMVCLCYTNSCDHSTIGVTRCVCVTRTVAITLQLALHGVFVLHEQLRHSTIGVTRCVCVTRTVAITLQLALHGVFVLHEQLR